MAKRIERVSFMTALTAAGLEGRPIAWGDDGSIGLGADLTDEERRKALEVLIAYEAPPEEKSE